jgi:hypothetical protein
MASTYSNIKIQLMATGENSTTWGNVTNTNLGTALEEAIVGSADVTFASANVTLTLTDTNATQVARHVRLRCTGATGGSTRNLVVPSIEKPYIVQNDCADSILVKTAAGTGITVPAGKTMWVYNDGVNVVDAVNHLTTLTLGTPLPILQGGTGSNLASGARTNLGATTVGGNLFTLTNPSAITFPRINADNTVSTLDAATFRTATGATTIGGNLYTLTNPSAVTFPRFNADNTVSALNAADFRTAIGAGSGAGTVTSVGMTVPAFLSVTPASITTSGTFAVTLSGTALPIANGGTGSTVTAYCNLTTNVTGTLPVANGGTGVTTSTGSGSVVLATSPTLVTPTLGAASATSITAALGAVGTPSYTFTGDTNTGIFSPAADTIAFVEGGVEAMRITSAGDIGVGTVAPQSKFHVSGGYITAGNVSSTAGSKIIGGDYSGAEHITTFGSEFSSGGPVVGYGVWPSTSAALAFVSSASVDLQRAAYTQTGNNHVWFTGASQTVAVGSAVTMTERMRLDGSGNLGLGTAPSGVRLDVNGSIRTTVGSGGTLSLFETDAVRANQLFSGADASGSFINATFSTGGTAVLRLQTANNERMRITAAGDVGIGVTNPGALLHAAGITRVSDATNSTAVNIDASTTAGLTSIIAQFGGSQLALGAAATEYVRINASGNVGIGTVSPGVRLDVNGTVRATGLNVTTATATIDGISIGYRSIPRSTTTTTAAVGDVGKCIAVTAGITIPNATFAAGDAVSIYNDSASAVTITQGASLTLRQAGTTNTGNRTLAARGMATIWFNSASEAIISGAGVS